MGSELVRTVDEYLVGRRSLESLESWLVARTRLINQSGDARARDLANRLEADLVDLSEAILDEGAIRDRWEGYLRQVSTIVVEPKMSARSQASTSTVTVRGAYAPEHTITLRFRPTFAG